MVSRYAAEHRACAVAAVLLGVCPAACGAPQDASVLQPVEPVTLDADVLEWKELYGAVRSVGVGVSFEGLPPRCRGLAHALGARHAAAVLAPESGPVISFGDSFNRTITTDPLLLEWFRAPRTGPALFVAERETDKLSQVGLPPGIAVLADSMTLRIEGSQAQLTWLDSHSTPWKAGRGTLDLATETWSDLIEAALPSPPTAEPAQPQAQVSGGFLPGDSPPVIVVMRDAQGGYCKYVSAPDAAAASWSPWASLGAAPRFYALAGAPLIIVAEEAATDGVESAGRPASDGGRVRATVWRLEGGQIAAAPLRLPPMEGQRVSSEALVFTRKLPDGESEHASMNTRTFAQAMLSGTEQKPWSGGLRLSVWAGRGEEIVQLATDGDGRLVARLFRAGEPKPVLEVLARSSLLPELAAWTDPTDVRSDREICLVGGMSGRRPVFAGLCFDLETRSFRTVKTRRPYALAHAGRECWQDPPRPGLLPLLACHFSRPPIRDHLAQPASAGASGWEITGMASSAR
jgi:hypothetical protein